MRRSGLIADRYFLPRAARENRNAVLQSRNLDKLAAIVPPEGRRASYWLEERARDLTGLLVSSLDLPTCLCAHTSQCLIIKQVLHSHRSHCCLQLAERSEACSATQLITIIRRAGIEVGPVTAPFLSSSDANLLRSTRANSDSRTSSHAD
jgi:hypothetical protein